MLTDARVAARPAPQSGGRRHARDRSASRSRRAHWCRNPLRVPSSAFLFRHRHKRLRSVVQRVRSSAMNTSSTYSPRPTMNSPRQDAFHLEAQPLVETPRALVRRERRAGSSAAAALAAPARSAPCINTRPAPRPLELRVHGQARHVPDVSAGRQLGRVVHLGPADWAPVELGHDHVLRASFLR
jgi:hypothetical protein